jgi:hypothetical protein
MINNPASLVKIASLDERNEPIHVADAPRRMNTMEKPQIKAPELSSTLAFSLLKKEFELLAVLISSRETPDIKDKYPGTSGRTHGDKNEIKPAANAI